MMESFKILGLTEKQQKLYLYVLEHGAMTASQLALELHEQRTNIYVLAEELEELGLVERNETQPVVRFAATNPARLQQLMVQKQQTLATTAAQLRKVLPDLQGMYQLSSHKPGFAYFEGLKGYTAALDDMVRSKKEVCVFAASDVSQARPDAWAVLQNKLSKRAHAKVDTRILFETSLREDTDIPSRERQRMRVRFWGDSVFEGEVAIYGHTVVLTTYDEKLVSLVIKNPAIAATMQAIFDTAWIAAEKPTFKDKL